MSDQYHAVYSESAARLEAVATALVTQRKLAPVDVAGQFLAIGLSVLTEDQGDRAAAEYLRKLARELDKGLS